MKMVNENLVLNRFDADHDGIGCEKN